MNNLNEIGFSERLLLLRRKKGLSQRAVARLLGISPTNVMNYEKGVHSPSVAILAKLAAIFNVSTDFLLLGKMHSNINDEELANAFFQADKLNEKSRKILKNLVLSFLDSQVN